MPEITKPRVLDAIAELAIAAGRFEDGGVLLGVSHNAPLDPGAVIRSAELETIRARAVSELGGAEVDSLFAEGADLNLDEALERGRVILAVLHDGRVSAAEPRPGL